MSYKESIPVVATEDLSSAQYRACDIDGTLAQVGDTAIGILQNKPESGEDGELSFSGRSRYRAGGTIAAGGRITCAASGWFTACVSGGAIVGRALSAVTSGSISEGVFNFATNAEQS